MKKLLTLTFAAATLATASTYAQVPSELDLMSVTSSFNGTSTNTVPLNEELMVTITIQNTDLFNPYLVGSHGLVRISVGLPADFNIVNTTLAGPDAASFGPLTIVDPQNFTIDLNDDVASEQFLTLSYYITGVSVSSAPGNMITQISGPATGSTANLLNYAISVDVATPVTLYDFNVKKAGESAVLNWATATESVNKGFVIERSQDTKTFEEVGFVSTKAENNTSNQKLSYNFQDRQPANGENFYRLKQVDLDGKTTYSEVKSVIFETASDIAIYPNPANGQFNIKGIQATDVLVITNSLGQQVLQQVANGTSVQLNLSGYANGIYDVTILDANGNRVQSSRISKIN